MRLAPTLLATCLLAAAAPPAVAEREGPVLHLRVDTIVHAVAAEHLVEGLARAEELDARAVVVELSTPGGVLSTTREMVKAMLAAPRPVVVWVAPSGAQAASAGFILLLAADVAAMTPGTNTGAAHPVGLGGGDVGGDMAAKVEEDTTALVRSLATRRGRDVDLAVAAVLESRAFTAEEALAQGLVERLATSLVDLLREVDGMTVEKGGTAMTLATADADVVHHEMSALRRILAALAHPQIASILMALGIVGLYAELQNPGAIFPGVIGVVALLLGFYGLSVLPVNAVGVALVVLAVALFVAETQVASFGLLTAAGAVSLIAGALLLFQDLDPVLRPPLPLIVALAASIVLVVGGLGWRAAQVRRLPVRTGKEGLLREVGVARSDLAPRGRVFIHGELWSAEAEVPVAAGSEVEVVGVEGLRLRVRPRAAPVPVPVSDAAEPAPPPPAS